jgi:hypothetical protein
MFERYEIVWDQGDVVIRGFYKSEMVIARILHSELEFIQCERSMKVSDQRGFVEHNAEIFIKIFWQRYQDGSTGDLNHLGATYKCVDIDGEDLLRVSKQLSAP